MTEKREPKSLADIRKELEDCTSGRKGIVEPMGLAFLMLELVNTLEETKRQS